MDIVTIGILIDMLPAKWVSAGGWKPTPSPAAPANVPSLPDGWEQGLSLAKWG
jgi:hypothetical protein